MNRIERRAKGLCTRCIMPATHGTMCEKHQRQNAEVTRRVRERKRAAGICECCSRPAKGFAPYATYCTRHALVMKLYMLVYAPEWEKARADRRRALGVCVRCGDKRWGQRMLCKKHTLSSREQCRTWYIKHKKAA